MSRSMLQSDSRSGDLHRGLLQVFPPRLKTVLSYVDQFTFTGATLSAVFGNENSFRLNSLYDPDYTGTGHQPYGYDQITPFYSRYMVDEVNVRITFFDPQGDGIYCGVFIKNYDDTATLVNSSVPQSVERPQCWVRPLSNTGSQKIVFERRIKIWELFGLTRVQYEAAWPTLAALVTTNPSVAPYLSVAVADVNASSPALTCKCTVEMDFYATFFGRITPGQS